MDNIFDTVSKYIEKQKKVIDSIDKDKPTSKVTPRTKTSGLPETKPVSTNKLLDEAKKAQDEARRKGWVK